MTNSPLSFDYEVRDTTRVASDSLRGYLHQILVTVKLWLGLSESEVLICEGNEDVDLIELDTDGRVRLATERQYKSEYSLPTGASALDTIVGFLRGFVGYRKDGQRCHFVFTTTATITAGRANATASDSVRDLIRQWSLLERANSEGRPEATAELADALSEHLRNHAQRLRSSQAGAESGALGGRAVQQAADIDELLGAMRRNGAWSEFLESVAWQFGSASLEETRDNILQDLTCRDAVLWPEITMAALVQKAFETAVNPDLAGRILTRIECLNVLAMGEVELRRWARQRKSTVLADFLSPLVSPRSYFFEDEGDDDLSLSGPIIGRREELEALVRSVTHGHSQVIMLLGSLGMGKSMMLSALATKLEAEGFKVFLVDRHVGLLQPETVLPLPPNNCRTLIIVDDATPQTAPVELAFMCLAQARNSTKILFAAWPENRKGLTAAARHLGFRISDSDQHSLDRLSWDDAHALARHALGPGLEHLVAPIATGHRDFPLAIAVGGSLIRKKLIPPSAVESSVEFRERVSARIADRAEQICDSLHASTGWPAREVIELLALLGRVRQPPHRSLERAASFLRLPSEVIARTLAALEATGLVVRRGRIWAVSPEILSLSLTQQACVQQGQTLGYGERVYDHFEGPERATVLCRIAEASYRSRVFERLTPFNLIWPKVVERISSSIQARRVSDVQDLQKVGFWQPEAVLALIDTLTQRIIEELEAQGHVGTPDQNQDHAEQRSRHAALFKPHDSLFTIGDAAADTLRSVCYHLEHLPSALKILFRLHRAGMGNKVVTWVAQYELDKDVPFHEAVLHFVERTLKVGDLASAQNLLDFIAPMVSRIGRIERSEGYRLVLGDFPVSAAATKNIRHRCRRIVTKCLRSGSPRLRQKALKIIDLAICPSPGINRPATSAPTWDHDDLAWLRLADQAASINDPTLDIQVLEAIHWAAKYARTRPKAAAIKIRNKIVRRSRTRRFAAIAGLAHLFVNAFTASDYPSQAEAFYAAEVARFPSVTKLDASGILRDLLRAMTAGAASCLTMNPFSFLFTLGQRHPRLGIHLVEAILATQEQRLYSNVGTLLSRAIGSENAAVSRVVSKILRSAEHELLVSIGASLISSSTWQAAPRLAQRITRFALGTGDVALQRLAVHGIAMPV